MPLLKYTTVKKAFERTDCVASHLELSKTKFRYRRASTSPSITDTEPLTQLEIAVSNDDNDADRGEGATGSNRLKGPGQEVNGRVTNFLHEACP